MKTKHEQSIRFRDDNERLTWIHTIAAAVQSYSHPDAADYELTIQDAANIADGAVMEYRKRDEELLSDGEDHEILDELLEFQRMTR